MPMDQLINFGLNTAGELLNTGLGLLLEGHNDERQLRQQEKLQQLQIRGQKEMTDYNASKQFAMWNATSYPAQVQRMKEAGINPALMYGMGGGGGQTASVNAGNVSGAQAPTGGGEAITAAGMGLQNAMSAQLMQAQKELIQSETEKNKVEAAKTAGVDTEQTKANIEQIWQGIDNAREQYQILRLEQTMKNIENYEKQASQEDRLDYIAYQTKLAMKQLTIATNEAKISGATLDDRIKLIQREAIGAALKNELTQAQTGKTKSDIQLNNEQISQWIQNNMREWDKMSLENRKIQVQELMQQYNTDPVNKVTEGLLHAIDNIFIYTKPK